MTPTPTLDAQRTDQLRSFLTVEAAADAARRRPVLTPARRRLVVGATAALLLAGGLVAVQSVGGSAPAAIAVEVDGEWTTVRIADIDADPDAVVADLRDAGFDAERRTLEVLRTDDGNRVAVGLGDDAPDGARGAVSVGGGGEGGAHGLVGLSVTLPDDVAPPSAPGESGRTLEIDPVDAQTSDGGVLVVEDDLLGAGIRFEPDGGVSLRAGTDATIVVATEA